MLQLSRREFLAATGPILLAAPGILYGKPVPHLSGDPIRVGIIGCGGRSTTAALQAIAADPGVVIWAMGDVFADRLAGGHERLTTAVGDTGRERVQVPSDRRFVGFDAYQGVIGSGVDAVILTTPPHFRPRHIDAAVRAGKHIFAETPLAVDAPGLRSVLASAETAKAKGTSLQTGFCWRHADAERAAFAKLKDGILGDVITVHSTYHGVTIPGQTRQPGWTDMEWQLRNWLHFNWLSGDHIVEQAVHSIDRLNWALGDSKLPVRATALGGRAARSGAESGNIYDFFTVIYEYQDGRRAFHTCRQLDGCPRDNSDHVYGKAGLGIINAREKTHTFKDFDGKVLWSYEGPSADMYQTAQVEFYSSIRAGGGGKAVNDGVRSAMATMMAIMGRLAAYTGQTVTWEEAMNSAESLGPGKYEFGDLPVAPPAVPGKPKST